MSDKIEAPVPDLRAMLAEATPPVAYCTVPLKQGHRQRIAALEAELERLSESSPSKRMGAKSPLKAKAEEIEALRAEMAASALTFRFEPLNEDERTELRQAMGGRDNPDEVNLRATAAMCREVTTADGRVFPGRMDWTDFRDLRDKLGVIIYERTIDAASNEAAGGDWSVPFSSSASLILATET